jgi:hypothetical protein
MDMSRSLEVSAWALPAATLVLLSAFTPLAIAANPAGFAYNASLTNVETFGNPTGLLIAGRCNRDHQKFKDARAGGAEVIVYLDPIEEPTTPASATDDEFYHPNGAATPLWPHANRTNYNGWPLADITAGSAWSDRVVSYVEGLMTNPDITSVVDREGERGSIPAPLSTLRERRSTLLLAKLRFERLLAFGDCSLVSLRIDPDGVANLSHLGKLADHVEVRSVRAKENVAR